MVNPTTVNVLLEAPVHGGEVDTWDQPVNRDWSAIDGLFGGVGIVGVTTGAVTLTKPAAVAVPAPGPFQSQNRALRFTGALVGNVTVTIPIATKYVINNQTTGNFNLIFRALNVGDVVAVPQGCQMSVYNDGTDCFFADLGKVGDMEFWAGLSAMPSWVAGCTVLPYLLNDGSIYNFSDYPHLGARLGSAFGGNGITTFGVPDDRGRVPLMYDGTGSRITVAGGAGFNGQTIGVGGGAQGVTLTAQQSPIMTGTGTGTGSTSAIGASNFALFPGSSVSSGSGGAIPTVTDSGTNALSVTVSSLSVTVNAVGGALHSNVQPCQVAGIWVTKT